MINKRINSAKEKKSTEEEAIIFQPLKNIDDIFYEYII
jgi:hypothetical protein